MVLVDDNRVLLHHCAEAYPYPIAAACRRYVEKAPEDPWREWEALSREILQAVLHYLSHMLLSDLVALGEQPPHLYHRIQGILTRPTAGEYVGFLRETTRHYREKALKSAFPKLLDFLLASEVDGRLLENGKPLLGLLVDYRNLWAHGKMSDGEAIRATGEDVKQLTLRLLKELAFLTEYPVAFEDGASLMGAEPEGLKNAASPNVVISAGPVSLRPLAVKLKGEDLVLLEDADLPGRKMAYRGHATYHRFTKKHLKGGDPAALLDALKDLLARVRADEAVLPRPDWDTFHRRASIETRRTLDGYEKAHKYEPRLFVPRPRWEGNGNLFEQFLESDKTLLALSGVQGTGKSALAAHLASRSLEEGHGVLFVNAQRFTFAEVAWTGNPYPDYFARLLHYEGGFDGAGLKRLCKQAPPGKKVVLFIDGINEVDGIEQKWNPFRAMELFLEWACSVAHPSVKVVLSFRLDLYEDFGYLEPTDLPENLAGVSRLGDHPRKPWVTELEPFKAEQARVLYERLQAIPELGLAPSMTWDEMFAGLGEQADHFTTNPLLFTVFLRAHHGLDSVITNDEEQIFLQYADRITGAAENRKKPWWSRVWGFLVNGNITRKERFLADTVSRMAQNGSAAYMTSQLDPNKARDKRLHTFIEDPHNTEYRDLVDSGLVVDELIGVSDWGEERTVRRITFFGEMMVQVMEGIGDKTERLMRLRSFLSISLVCAAIAAIIYGAIFLAFIEFTKALSAKLAVSGFDQASYLVFRRTVWSCMFHPIVVMLFLLGVMLYILVGLPNLLKKIRHHRIKDVGLFAMAYTTACEQQQMAFLFKGMWYSGLFLGAVCLSALVVYMIIGWSVFSIILILVFVGVPQLPYLSFYVTPWGTTILCRMSGLKIHPRLVHKASKVLLDQMGSEYTVRVRRKNHLIHLGFIAAVIPIVAYLFLWSIPPPDTPEVNSYAELIAYSMVFLSPEIQSTVKGPLLILSVFLCVAGAFINIFMPAIYFPYLSRKFHSVFHRRPDMPPILKPMVKFVGVSVGLGIAGLLAGILLTLPEGRLDDKTVLQSLGVPKEKIHLDERGRLKKLDLSEMSLGPGDAEKIYGFRHLVELSLRPGRDTRFDLSRMKVMNKITAPAMAIPILPDTYSGEIIVLDPVDWVGELPRGRYPVKALEIRGSCNSLSTLPMLFPSLMRLRLEEETARKCFKEDFDFWVNLTFTINSEGPPQLDWLRPGHCKYIIRLEEPMDGTTQNLNLLKRLTLRADDLDPVFLNKTQSVRWLFLELEKSPPSAWYERLHDAIEIGLPELVRLELQKFEGDERKGKLFTAKGRADALAMLSRFITKPELLEEK